MAKALKTAAIVVGGAALVMTGIGAVAGVALGFGAAAGIGAVAAGVGVSASTLFMVSAGLSMAGSLLAPRPKAPQTSPENANRLFASIDARTPRKIVLGSTALATDIRDQEYTGDQAYFHRFIVVASHRIHAVRQIWFDDLLVWTAAGGVIPKLAGYLTITPVLEGSAANAINISPRMGSSRRYTGCAYLHIRYKLTGNSKDAESPYVSAIPSRVTVEGDAAYLYDPRLDSTAGGVGAMRAANQATWTVDWNADRARNPALQLLFYLLGWRINGKLAVGKGIPPERIDLESFITAANLCDEPVAKASGGTEPRYRSDGVFSEGDDPSVVLDSLKASMNAVLDDVDGRIRLTVLHNDLATPVADFTEDDVLGAFRWEQTPPLSDTFNVIRGGYTDASAQSLYQLVDAPEVRIESPDGIDRIETINLPTVQSASQWQRLAKQRLQRMLYSGTFSAVFQATAWRVQKGDVIRLSFKPLGWSNKLFRVADVTVQVDGTVPMVLRVEHPEIYSWDASDAAPVTGAEPTTYDPALDPLGRRLALLGQAVDRGLFDPATLYSEGNIVTLGDGSRWLYVAEAASAGNAPAEGSAYWSILNGPLAEIGGRPVQDILDAVDQLADDPNSISPLEKRTGWLDTLNELNRRYNALVSRAGTPPLNGVAEIVAYRNGTAASISLDFWGYVTGLEAPWNDPDAVTVYDPAVFEAKLAAYRAMLDEFAALIEAFGVSYGDVIDAPTSLAELNLADAEDLATAKEQAAAAVSDLIITVGEKADWEQERSRRFQEVEAIRRHSAKSGVSSAAVDTAYSYLEAYLSALPNWSAPTLNTVLSDRGEWNAKWAALWDAISDFYADAGIASADELAAIGATVEDLASDGKLVGAEKKVFLHLHSRDAYRNFQSRNRALSANVTYAAVDAAWAALDGWVSALPDINVATPATDFDRATYDQRRTAWLNALDTAEVNTEEAVRTGVSSAPAIRVVGSNTIKLVGTAGEITALAGGDRLLSTTSYTRGVSAQAWIESGEATLGFGATDAAGDAAILFGIRMGSNANGDRLAFLVENGALTPTTGVPLIGRVNIQLWYDEVEFRALVSDGSGAPAYSVTRPATANLSLFAKLLFYTSAKWSRFYSAEIASRSADSIVLEADNTTVEQNFSNLYSDGVITRAEKPQFIRDYDNASARYLEAVTARAQYPSLEAEYEALSTAYDALVAATFALQPQYNDKSADSPVPAATDFEALFAAFHGALRVLNDKLTKTVKVKIVEAAASGGNVVGGIEQSGTTGPDAEGYYTFQGNNAKLFLVGNADAKIPWNGEPFVNITTSVKDDTGVGEATVALLFDTASSGVVGRAVNARTGGVIAAPLGATSYYAVQQVNFTAGSIKMRKAVIVPRQESEVDNEAVKGAVNNDGIAGDQFVAFSDGTSSRSQAAADSGAIEFHEGDVVAFFSQNYTDWNNPPPTFGAKYLITKLKRPTLTADNAGTLTARIEGYNAQGAVTVSQTWDVSPVPFGTDLDHDVKLAFPAGTISYRMTVTAEEITGSYLRWGRPSVRLSNVASLGELDPARDQQVSNVAEVAFVPVIGEAAQLPPSYYVNMGSNKAENLLASVIGLPVADQAQRVVVTSTTNVGPIDQNTGRPQLGYISSVDQTAVDKDNVTWKRQGRVDINNGSFNTWGSWSKSFGQSALPKTSEVTDAAGIPQSDGALITAQGTAKNFVGQDWGATAPQSLIDNRQVALGANQVVDSGFLQGLRHFQVGVYRPADFSLNDAGYHGKRNVVFMYGTEGGTLIPLGVEIADASAQGAWFPASSVPKMKQYGMPVKAGERIAARALVSCHRSLARLYALVFNEFGGLVEAPAIGTGFNNFGGLGGDGFGTMEFYYTVTHPDAAYCQIMMRMLGSGEANPYLFFSEPWLGKLAPDQTTIPAYTPGPVDPMSDVTLENFPVLEDMSPITIVLNRSDNSYAASQVPVSRKATLKVGGVDRSAEVQWSLASGAGATATVNNTSTLPQERGTVTVTDCKVATTISVLANFKGVLLRKELPIQIVYLDPPPEAAPTSLSVNTFTRKEPYSGAGTSNRSAYTAWLAVKVPASGQLTWSLNTSYAVGDPSLPARTPTANYSYTSAEVEVQWSSSVDGSSPVSSGLLRNNSDDPYNKYHPYAGYRFYSGQVEERAGYIPSGRASGLINATPNTTIYVCLFVTAIAPTQEFDVIPYLYGNGSFMVQPA